MMRRARARLHLADHSVFQADRCPTQGRSEGSQAPQRLIIVEIQGATAGRPKGVKRTERFLRLPVAEGNVFGNKPDL